MKDCPDLSKFTLQQKQEFWSSHEPSKLKRIGDRLLAESLPHIEAQRPREDVSREIAEARAELGWSPEKLSETLGVTTELFIAWEEDRVKSPESLPYLLGKLNEIKASS